MDSLRPELDELNQYKTRQDKSKRPNKKPAKSSASQSPDKAVGKSGSSIFASLLIFFLVVACGALGYFFWKQQQELVALQEKFSESDTFINQSKLLIARLEGRLSETGAELEQSGTDAKKKLDFLDSEMRKLWGVSNDRNKKSISKNSDDIEQIKKSLSQLKKDQSSKYEGLSQKLSQVANQGDTLDGRLAAFAGELSIVRAEQEERLNSMNSAIQSVISSEQSLKKQMSDLLSSAAEGQKKIEELQPMIDSINKSRRQLVQRIIGLEEKIAKLNEPVKSSGAAPSL